MSKSFISNPELEKGPLPGIEPVTLGLYAAPEVKKPTTLEIEGTIPEWVKGSLYRGAAATWDVGNYTAEHWFDGFSRNHRFEIADGAVSYRSRNASDELMDFVRETGKYPGGSFGSDPCKTIFGAFEAKYRDGTNKKGQASVGTVGVSYAPGFAGLTGDGKARGAPLDVLVSTTDANELQKIDPVTLEPKELFTYEASDPLLVSRGHSAAHSVVDEDGTIFNYVLDRQADVPTYHVFKVSPPNGETKVLATITDAPPAYIHAVFGSEKHIVLVVWQADFVNDDALTILDAIGPWDPNRKAIFYVIDRFDGGLLRKYESPDAFFAFHEINTFENDQGDIFIDLPRMDDYSFIFAAKMENLRANLGTPNANSKNDLAGAFTRYKLPYQSPAADGAVPLLKAEIDIALPLAQANIELPRIHPGKAGKPYRYSWGIHVEKVGNFADSIVKIDAQEQKWLVWSPKTRHVPSEPIFVPRPGGTEEDDGVVLTVVMDASVRQSSLVVLDAKTMTELARAKMPVVMTYGFHGTWGDVPRL